MPNAFDLSTSILASTFRGWRGTADFRGESSEPEQLLELYEFEACPYCRLVREALTELELDALIYPCPQGGTRYRPKAIEISGKNQFPLLIDPNTGDQLLESADIVDHLQKNYGYGQRANRGLLRGLQIGGSYLATASRGGRGLKARPSRAPELPLELYSFESSPYSRPVRERLTELEIPYRLRSFPKTQWQEMGPPIVRSKLFPKAPLKSRNRIRLRELTGRSQVPYLIDPNTDTAMFESDDIIRYLEQTYAL